MSGVVSGVKKGFKKVAKVVKEQLVLRVRKVDRVIKVELASTGRRQLCEGSDGSSICHHLSSLEKVAWLSRGELHLRAGQNRFDHSLQ